eukprot:11746239-Alexandrium_andersonii.AAC.1
MPQGTGDDSEAFERFVYLQTAKKRKGDSDPDDLPPDDFKADCWIDSTGGICDAKRQPAFGLRPMTPADSG